MIQIYIIFIFLFLFLLICSIAYSCETLSILLKTKIFGCLLFAGINVFHNTI